MWGDVQLLRLLLKDLQQWQEHGQVLPRQHDQLAEGRYLANHMSLLNECLPSSFGILVDSIK